jgi:hypothetical protein
MDLLRQEKLRERYLVALWETHSGKYGSDKPNREVCEKAGIDYDKEALIICQYLQRKGYISWSSFEWVHLEPEGIFEAERLVKSTYQEKANRVLRKLYEMSGHAHIDWVDGVLIAEKLNMSLEEISLIFDDLQNRKRLISRQGDDFRLTGSAIEALESGGQNPASGATVYNMNIRTMFGPAQQGPGGVQNAPQNWKRLQQEYLLKLFQLSGGDQLKPVPSADMRLALAITEEEEINVMMILQSKGLANFLTGGHVHILPGGIDAVEAGMEKLYLEKQYVVLKKTYDVRKESGRNVIGVHILVKEINLPEREIYDILKDLEEQGFIDWSGGDIVMMKAAGMEVIESAPKPHSPSVSYSLNVHGDNYGGVQQGSNNTQNIMVNQPISEILPKLAELISAIKAQDFEDKDEVIADLENVHALASGDVNGGVWKRIQTRLTAAKTTMEITGLAYKSLPYWPLIWHYFMK